MRSFRPAVSIQSLEPRRLLAVPASINFQPGGASTPAGYVADTGLAFGDRGSGYQFGWDAAITSATRDRNSPLSPDQRYDTLIHTQLGGSRKWEVAVPNGSYTVRLVAGDPGYFDSVYKFNVENVLALSGTPTSGSRWIDKTVTVTVSDGRLTLTNASGASNNKLAFMTIAPGSQPPTTQSPFGGAAWPVPGTIQAENFDNGSEGVAYHDIDSANLGGAYRSTGVDIQPTSDAGGGYNVGYVRSGEWLEYTINVASSGAYSLDLRIAAVSSGRSFFVAVDSVNKTGNVAIPNTGGWQSWRTLTRTGIALTAGQHVVRVQFDSSASTSGIANLNWLRFNPQAASAWSTGASVPVALAEVAGGIINNKLYLVGGGSMSTFAYDIASNTWSTLSPRLNGADHHAAEVLGGKLYLIGGLNGSAAGKLQIYNPATNSWSQGAATPFAAGSSSTAVIGGYIYSAGGIVGSTTTNRLVRYDPSANTWTELAPMPQGRNHAAAATDGSKLYIFGGRGAGSGDSNTVANGFNTVQIYDPASNTWQSSGNAGSTIAPLPQARGGMGKAVYYNGEFYVIGGETATGAGATANKVYNRVDIYNPSTNTWRLGQPMPTARHGIFPLLESNKIYIPAGGVVAGDSKSSVLEILSLIG